MQRVNQPFLLAELKWMWTDKFQSTISKYQQAFKDNSYVSFIEKSVKFQKDIKNQVGQQLRDINASLTAINISIAENEAKIGVSIKINKKVEDTKLKYI